jgi:hypothetical protein
MPRKITTTTNWAEPAENQEEDEVVVEEPITVSNTDGDLVKARVKGTWLMIWGQAKFDFKDGKTYKLPKDLFNYLRANGNIYDTMA